MEKRKITISFGPSVILFAALVILGIVLVKYPGNKGRHSLTIGDSPVIATRIRSLGELTTACFYDEVVVSGTKENLLSTSPLGSIARDGFGRDVDDHIVIIARGTVRAGIDLSQIDRSHVRISRDTAIITLPEVKYFDTIVNPSDMEVFAESGRWSQQEVGRLQESARRKLILEAEEADLRKTARDGAVDAISDLLKACGYTYIRFDSAPSCNTFRFQPHESR
ncbi:MAG: DUF4230 domain-containing protein [Bacteroidales bacterium]|nr:DUF4230 domain-containing protein [Bacteroidales bacterium]MBR1510097.1 DUF4230 domain-containing protein [Bacteroidales bacterium]